MAPHGAGAAINSVFCYFFSFSFSFLIFCVDPSLFVPKGPLLSVVEKRVAPLTSSCVFTPSCVFFPCVFIFSRVTLRIN